MLATPAATKKPPRWLAAVGISVLVNAQTTRTPPSAEMIGKLNQ